MGQSGTVSHALVGIDVGMSCVRDNDTGFYADQSNRTNKPQYGSIIIVLFKQLAPEVTIVKNSYLSRIIVTV